MWFVPGQHIPIPTIDPADLDIDDETHDRELYVQPTRGEIIGHGWQFKVEDTNSGIDCWVDVDEDMVGTVFELNPPYWRRPAKSLDWDELSGAGSANTSSREAAPQPTKAELEREALKKFFFPDITWAKK